MICALWFEKHWLNIKDIPVKIKTRVFPLPISLDEQAKLIRKKNNEKCWDSATWPASGMQQIIKNHICKPQDFSAPFNKVV